MYFGLKEKTNSFDDVDELATIAVGKIVIPSYWTLVRLIQSEFVHLHLQIYSSFTFFRLTLI